MRHAVVLKLALVSAFATAAVVSSQIQFETSALDDRDTEKSAAKHDSNLKFREKAALTDTDLTETHARPLFNPDRRPFLAKPPVVEQSMAVPEPVVAQPASLPRRLVLIGTNAGTSEGSVLVRQQESEEVRWLTIGETFDGWRLTAASEDGASFICAEPQGGDCKYQLELYSETRGE